MNLIFKIFLAYDNRFGMLPKLIKSLRASGDPKELKAAESLQAQLDERKRNPPKNIEEMMRRSLETSRQIERDLRVEGRHADAEKLAGMIDYTEQNSSSKRK